MQNLNWIKIGESIPQLAALCNPLYKLEISERRILVYHDGSNFFAFTAACPHAGYDLSKAKIDAEGTIICPLHGYRFCVKNGRSMDKADYKLFTYPIEIRTEGIYIGFRDSVF